MDNSDLAREWFKIAEADLDSARFLRQMQPVPIEIICYHCQQSAEKFLKGFLTLKGEKIKKSHDLVLLCNECKRYDESFEQIRESCLMLTDFAVHIRYPYPMDLNESDMKTALQHAAKIKKFVLKKAGIKN
jgi:HEPN domain-containing protein